MLEIAMKLVGVDEEELFYLKNKTIVDEIGSSFISTKVA